MGKTHHVWDKDTRSKWQEWECTECGLIKDTAATGGTPKYYDTNGGYYLQMPACHDIQELTKET
jgi:hypothetical protein